MLFESYSSQRLYWNLQKISELLNIFKFVVNIFLSFEYKEQFIWGELDWYIKLF